MSPREYIGVTGFMNRTEIDEVLQAVPDDSDTFVMVGVLASSKTIKGLPNKWPRRYPQAEALGSIFSDHRNVLNLLHFNTRELDMLYDDMRRAQEMAGPNCHGFQLNIPWPDPRVLEAYKFDFDFSTDHHTIVLQCGGNALDQVGRDPVALAKRVHEYRDLIDYVLIDPSGGFGKPFDPAFAFDCFEALSEYGHESIGKGIAGGLHASNLECLDTLLEAYKFSIDAEGKIRDNADDLDIEAAKAYLRAAERLFQTYSKVP